MRFTLAFLTPLFKSLKGNTMSTHITAQTLIDSRNPAHPNYTINFGKVLSTVLAGIVLATDAYGNEANIPIDLEQFVQVFTQTWLAPKPVVPTPAPTTHAPV